MPMLLKSLLTETNIWEFYVAAVDTMTVYTILSVEKHVVWWMQVFLLEHFGEKKTVGYKHLHHLLYKDVW